MRVNYIFPLLLLLLASCSNDKLQKEIPVTESEVLNEFIRQAPVQFIGIDTTATDTIRLKEEDIIFDFEDHEDAIELGRLSKVVLAGDQFYAWSFGTNRIHRIEMDGTLSGPYLSIGQGPGEYERVWDMDANTDQIMIVDYQNGRINIHDHDMNFMEQVDEMMSDKVSLNEEYIILDGAGPGMECDGFILSRHELKDLEKEKEFMPCIIPVGYQPYVHNNAVAKINNRNEVAASFQMLPWISILDEDLNLRRTLIIDDPRYADMNVVPIEIRKPNPERNPGGVGGSMMLGEFIYLDNGDLIVQNKEILYLKMQQDGSYEIKGNYALQAPNGEDQWVLELQMDKEGQLYASNWNRIFRIDLLE